MKNIFNRILLSGLILSVPLLVFGDKPLIIKKSSPVLSKKNQAADAESEKKALGSILVSVLNQVSTARMDFDIDFSSTSKTVNGKKTSSLSLKLLDLSAVIAFKDHFAYQFGDEKKIDPQVQKVIPRIVFKTKEMTVVSRAAIAQKGSLKIRFCQSYSVNNDVCNTFNDERLLEVSVESKNFSMLEIKLKEINVDFDQKVKDGKFSFKGTCTAFKSAIDTASATPFMKPVDCAFAGEYDPNAGDKFSYSLKFKSKNP